MEGSCCCKVAVLLAGHGRLGLLVRHDVVSSIRLCVAGDIELGLVQHVMNTLDVDRSLCLSCTGTLVSCP